jgi:hypothetical protein
MAPSAPMMAVTRARTSAIVAACTYMSRPIRAATLASLSTRRCRASSPSCARLGGSCPPARKGIGQHQDVAGNGAGVGQDLVRVHRPGHRQPVLGLGVVDRVAPGYGRARGDDHVAPAAEDLAEHLGAETLEWEGDDVEREHRRRAHRVDV